jgi:hypothetical protein
LKFAVAAPRDGSQPDLRRQCTFAMSEEVESLPGMMRTAPENWGDDTLSQFMSAGWRNAVDAFIEDPERYLPLAEVDGIYRRLIENLADSPEQLAGTQLVRSHASYLAAASLALTGQVAEAYRLMRGALQAALLGAYVAGNPERQQLWAARNDGKEARTRTRAEFNHERLQDHLHTLDPATAKISATLRERAFEHESHPNTYAALSNARAAGARFDFTREYFVTGDEVQRYCLRTATQTGICALSVLFYVFPERYRTLGLADRITKLRHGH